MSDKGTREKAGGSPSAGAPQKRKRRESQEKKQAPPKKRQASVRQLDEAQAKLTGEERELASTTFQRTDALPLQDIGDRKLRGKMQKTQRLAEEAAESAVKAQTLLTEAPGYLEPDGPMEKTYELSQSDLVPHVDLQTAAKMFELSLDSLGPYSVAYSRHGQSLLLCGEKGHVAVLDWQTKRLHTELHLNETCRDAIFLHNETFFAVAQRKYAYIYDHHGTELHRLEHMNSPQALEFLPFHFLLASVNAGGCLRYQDTSTGDYVANIYTKMGPTHVLRQNPWNAVLNLGHKKGVVSMWAPNTAKPLVQMQCHAAPVTSLAVDSTGHYLVTAGHDSRLKIWDIRTYQELYSYHTPSPATSLDISQRGVISVGCGALVEMWKDAFREAQSAPYMRHRLPGQSVESVRFAPFEDFLGVGHTGGFSSVVVPGSGEPHFDSYASNPYHTAKQRSEAEVRGLLDKIQPEMIQLDPTLVGGLARHTQYEAVAENEFLPETKAVKEKNKQRGRNKSSARIRKKQANVWDQKRELIKESQEKKKKAQRRRSGEGVPKALSRFK